MEGSGADEVKQDDDMDRSKLGGGVKAQLRRRNEGVCGLGFNLTPHSRPLYTPINHEVSGSDQTRLHGWAVSLAGQSLGVGPGHRVMC
jgi:hypothetical protein